MFNYIKGTLVGKTHAHAIIDVQGIGYELNISLNTHAGIAVGKPCQLFCHLYIKDDSHTLYGFREVAEKRLFLHLIGVSGVGPSTALAMLSSLSVLDLQQAIVNGDTKTVQSVKGIGAKTAQRLILELKDKLQKEGIMATDTAIPSQGGSPHRAEAVEALIALGLPKSTADKSVTAVLKKKADASVEEIIRLALRS